MLKKPKLSIIIVHYKAKEELFNCLKSIRQNEPKSSFEVIVVDNDEKKTLGPRLKRKFPWVSYVKAPGNVGYAAGNNLGANNAKGEYLFILNPDTKVFSGSVDKLVDFLKGKKDVGVVAPNPVDKKGEVFPQLGSSELTPLRGIVALSFLNKLFPGNRISRDYWMENVPTYKKREVDVAPGSALLVRKKVFDEVRGFDESFFLFFEESDFCKRVKEIGYRIFIIPQAEVLHLKGRSTPKTEKVKEIFTKSRFYYFKKHYGVFFASVVEAFARFSKWHAALIAIIGLGTFLRFYRIEQNLVFHGELGHNYLAIKNFIAESTVPLLGPPTSHPWLSFGPLYYWIFGPILALFGYNPEIGAYFFAVAGVLVIIVNYFFVKKIFNEKVALLSSFLIAISPSFIKLTRDSRFFSLTVVFFYPFLYFLIKSLKEGGKYLFWTGFFLGVMLNFHLTPIVLIPAIFTLIYVRRTKFKGRDLFNGFVGILVPNIPFLLHNAMNGFIMITKFTLWIPYRILGFTGIYPKNTASVDVVKENIISLYNFIAGSFLPDRKVFAFILVLTVGTLVVVKTKEELAKKRKDIVWITILMIFAWGYFGIFIHGDSPTHYYLPLYPLPILFLSLFFSKLLSRRQMRLLFPVFLAGILFINLRYYFSEKWAFISQAKITKSRVPYSLQLEIAETIINDAKARGFKLSRAGPFDEFEADFAQNYQYLLWWLGNEPAREAKLHYTIYEDTMKLEKDPRNEIFLVGPIVILKENFE